MKKETTEHSLLIITEKSIHPFKYPTNEVYVKLQYTKSLIVATTKILTM